MSDANATIQEVFTQYQTAVYTKDVDALVDLYAEDVRIFDMWDQWSSVGSNALREMTTAWFDSLGDDFCVVHFDAIQTIPGAALAAATAFARYQRQSASGEVTRAMDNRISWVLKQAASGWIIAHQHTSAPLDFKTAQARFDR
jgi:uncharacterized protein (TIGR02246 family)